MDEGKICKDDEIECLTVLRGLLQTAVDLGYSCDSPVPTRCEGQTVKTDGKCGSVSGGTSSTKPIDNLCEEGTPTSVVENANGTQWLWRCDSIDGGNPSPACFVTKDNSPPSGKECSYSQGGLAYVEGSCVTTGTCSESNKGASSDCSGGEICCGGKLEIPIDGGGDCSSGLVPCGRNCDNPLTEEDETQICTLCHLIVGIDNIIDYIFLILGVVGFLILVIGGITYIVSAGNQTIVTAAKKAIFSGLIGFTIVLIAWVSINTVIVYLFPLNQDGNIGGKILGWDKFTCDTDK